MSTISLPTCDIASLRDRDPLEQAVIGFLLRLSNQNTFREYQRDLKNFLAWCADQPIDPLSPDPPVVGLLSAGERAP
jgi:hypothetical protein